MPRIPTGGIGKIGAAVRNTAAGGFKKAKNGFGAAGAAARRMTPQPVKNAGQRVGASKFGQGVKNGSSKVFTGASGAAKAARDRAGSFRDASVGKYKKLTTKRPPAPRPATPPGTMDPRRIRPQGPNPLREARQAKVKALKQQRMKTRVKTGAKIAGGAAAVGGAGYGANKMYQNKREQRSFALDKRNLVLTGQGKNKRWRKRDAAAMGGAGAAGFFAGRELGKRGGAKVVGMKTYGMSKVDGKRMADKYMKVGRGKASIIMPQFLDFQGKARNTARQAKIDSINEDLVRLATLERYSRDNHRPKDAAMARSAYNFTQGTRGKEARVLRRANSRYANAVGRFTKTGGRYGAAIGTAAAAGAAGVYIAKRNKNRSYAAEGEQTSPKWKKKVTGKQVSQGVAGVLAATGRSSLATTAGYAATRELTRKGAPPGERVSKKQVAKGVAKGTVTAIGGGIAGGVTGSLLGAGVKAASRGKINATPTLGMVGKRAGMAVGAVKGYESVGKYKPKKTKV